MLTVRCPKCGRHQRTQPRGRVSASVKRCVYCGKSFKVHTHLRDTRIVDHAGRMPSAEELAQQR